MGCQKKIAEKIYERGGEYVLTVKDNQGSLKQAMAQTFDYVEEKQFADTIHDYYENIEADHGRIETRKYYVLPLMYFLGRKLKWKGLNSLIMVESTRTNKATGVTTKEKRYYISSMKMDAKKIATAIRNHWKIENNLHWCLDVIFREDACRVRIKNAAENMSLLRKLVLLLIKKEKTSKRSLNGKRLKASWSTKYLQQVLTCA
jgi:predicted transposase YbfD/YdcC